MFVLYFLNCLYLKMEVVAVSRSQPRGYEIGGHKMLTSIVHDPLVSKSDYIELDESGVLDNATAARYLLLISSSHIVVI